MPHQTFHKILIARTDRIGDVVLSTPVISVLRSHFPGAQIDVMVSAYTAPVVEGHPDVDDILIYNPPQNVRELLRLARDIRQRGYDAVLVLHPRGSLAMLFFLARIPIRVGSGYRAYSLLFNRRVYHHRKRGDKHELDYNLELVQALGVAPGEWQFEFHVPVPAAERLEALLREIGLARDATIILLHPGSGGSARDWPPEYFGALADRLAGDGRAAVVFSGGKGDAGVIDQALETASTRHHRLDGQLTLKELAALIQRSALFVSNSTGPLHIAVALGRPVIGIYCPIEPTHPRRWGPYGQRENVFMPDVPPCPKCIEEKCPYWDCMHSITVDQVFQRAMELLSFGTEGVNP